MTPSAQKYLRLLLGKGYFPKELPPVFTTSDFGFHAPDILCEWEAEGLFKVKKAKSFKKIKGKVFRGRYSYKNVNAADPEIISMPKKLHERRNLHVTHPVPQALLCREIAENWRSLQKILSKGRYSNDQIVLGEAYDRSIKGINFQLHEVKKKYIESTSDWLVRTDITRFYPSIYTHSISWAAYGKDRVKSSLNTYDGSFADRLDVLVRACNRNQTVGLPIGPETSRIIAEVISSRIDLDYYEALPSSKVRKSVDRLQDDWFIGVSTREEAEKVISVIGSCYREYGLEINGSKTSIAHILELREESWRSELSEFLSSKKGQLHGSRLEDFLNLCIRLQLKFPKHAVMNYALSVVEGGGYAKSDSDILESFLLKAAAISPLSMDYICRIILNMQHHQGSISRRRVSERFVDLAEKSLEKGHLFEAIWLLYTIRGMRKVFKARRIIEYAEHINSSVLRFLLLDMCKMGISSTKPPLEIWAKEISEESVLLDGGWLFAYEAIRKGWMPDPTGLLSKGFFRPLDQRNVTFYDTSKNVMNSRFVRKRKSDLRRHQNLEVLSLLTALRGFSSNNGRYG